MDDFGKETLVERCRCGKKGPLNGQIRAMLDALEAKGAIMCTAYLRGDEFIIEGVVPPAPPKPAK